MDKVHALREKYIYRLFRLGIFLKGILSLFEIFVGTAFLFISPLMIGNFIVGMSQDELAEEPGSFLASHALPLAQQFSLTPGTFIAIYLLSRGIIKLALVIALLKNKLWAYPAALVVLGLFMAYQVYRVTVAHSVFLTLLTLFDVIVVWLIWHEYQVVRKGSQRT